MEFPLLFHRKIPSVVLFPELKDKVFGRISFFTCEQTLQRENLFSNLTLPLFTKCDGFLFYLIIFGNHGLTAVQVHLSFLRNDLVIVSVRTQSCAGASLRVVFDLNFVRMLGSREALTFYKGVKISCSTSRTL